jgi:hypothetical protein
MIMLRIRASEGSGSRDCPLSTSSGFPEEAVKDSVPLLIVGGPSWRNLEPQALHTRIRPLRSIAGDVRLQAPWMVPHYNRYAAGARHSSRHPGSRDPSAASIDDRVHQGEQGSLLLWLRGLILIAVGYQ